MTKTLDSISQHIRRAFPEASVDVHCFDSGAAILDVRFGDSLFVVECYPDGVLSVYEAKDDQPFGSGFRPRFDHTDSATNELVRLIEDHRKNPAPVAAAAM